MIVSNVSKNNTNNNNNYKKKPKNKAGKWELSK